MALLHRLDERPLQEKTATMVEVESTLIFTASV